MTVQFLDRPQQEEEFQLPLSGLYADVDAGRGSIRFDDSFDDCDVVNQLRIVQDWQRDLADIGARVLARLFRTRFATLPVSRDEQVARFTRYCARLGLDCPSELAAGLAAPLLARPRPEGASTVPAKTSKDAGTDADRGAAS